MAVRALRLSTTFDSLQNPAFRWLWLGRLASSATFEMGTVAQGWVVYQLTGSALALGWVGVGGSLATLLLSPYAGALVDRADKRVMLLWTRVAMLINCLVVGVLVSLGTIQVWHLAVSALVGGVLNAFMMPALQTLISDLVDRRTLLNAVSMNALGMGMMGVLGASSAGIIIKIGGPATVYYTMAAFFVLGIYSNWKLPQGIKGHVIRGSLWTDLVGGIKYIKLSPTLLALLGIGLVRVIFAMPYRSLMPAFAQGDLGFDSTGLGFLSAAPGLGGMMASLLVCSRGDPSNKGKWLMVSGVGMGLTLMLFVATPWLPVVFLFLVLTGAFNNIVMVFNNTLLQAHSDVAYRGRVLSIYMMTWGLSPLGTLPAGAIADRYGVPIVIIVQGAATLLLFWLIMSKRSELKSLN